jgi:mRNA-degrading endonuclease YafQ of YafQ-DinJ toxin-antitoxin module
MATKSVQILQSSSFARSYKKLHSNQKQDVDRAVLAIVEEPLIGEQKRGDLTGVYVYKFKSQSQLMLLAYEFDPKTRHLLLLGTHENFYRELKRS